MGVFTCTDENRTDARMLKHPGHRQSSHGFSGFFTECLEVLDDFEISIREVDVAMCWGDIEAGAFWDISAGGIFTCQESSSEGAIGDRGNVLLLTEWQQVIADRGVGQIEARFDRADRFESQ